MVWACICASPDYNSSHEVRQGAEPKGIKKMKLTPSQIKEIQFQTNMFSDGYFPVDFELTQLCDGAVLLTVTEYRSLSTEWAGFIVGDARGL